MDGGSGQSSDNSDNHLAVSEQGLETNEAKPLSTAVPSQEPEGSISWTASEFIVHKKGALWYLSLSVVTAFVAFISWFLTNDITSAAVIIVAGVLLMVYGTKGPHEISYRIDYDGLHIGNRSIPFEMFRSFSIDHREAFSSLVLNPMKRFSLVTTLYYDPQDEKKILDIISSYLPLEEKGRDLIDDLMWKIRF